jgi:hypothetical protein
MSLSSLFVDMGAQCTSDLNGTVTTTDFIPQDGFGLFQLIFIILVYGYILASASKMIADGSELLLLVMDPGIVGEAVLIALRRENRTPPQTNGVMNRRAGFTGACVGWLLS